MDPDTINCVILRIHEDKKISFHLYLLMWSRTPRWRRRRKRRRGVAETPPSGTRPSGTVPGTLESTIIVRKQNVGGSKIWPLKWDGLELEPCGPARRKRARPEHGNAAAAADERLRPVVGSFFRVSWRQWHLSCFFSQSPNKSNGSSGVGIMARQKES